MKNKKVKLLDEERKKRKSLLVQKLLNVDRDMDNIRKDLEWVNLTDQLIGSSSNKPKLFWPILIGMICLLVIGIAWTQRIQSTQISFEIVSSNVGFQLTEDWELNKVYSLDYIYINSLDQIISPNLDIEFHRNSPNDDDDDDDEAFLEITGKEISLSQLRIRDSASLDLMLNQNKLTFEVKGKPINGKIDVTRVQIKGIKDTLIDLREDYESIEFISSKTNSFPVKFEINTNDLWEFRDFRTSQLNFQVEYPLGSNEWESTIKSGEIRILQTGAIEKLREDDKFLLKDVQTRRLELSKTEEGIKVYFEGKVSAISAGPAGFEKNLAPTFLEYIYYQKSLAFFWSAIVFLWGFLWSFKNTFLRN